MMGHLNGEKSSPLRQCAACRKSAPREQLWRFVRGADHQVGFDPEGRAQGRGAYLCRRGECVVFAARRGHLARALKVMLPEPLVLQLAELAKQSDEKSG
jgi:predicted RNA-binding protein YlxR (DUF448 family)